MPVDSDPEHKQPARSRIQSDLQLTRTIACGSETAWQDFLARFSQLIFDVLRRHLIAEDEDDVRGVYVEVLHSLYTRDLAKFRGEVQLSTWLIVYTRSRAYDFFRKHHGRHRIPTGYEQLGDFDRRVLECHLVKRLPMDVTLQLLAWGGTPATVDDIAESVGRIESTMDRRYLLRIESEHQAESRGVDSVRMLSYITELQRDFDEEAGHGQPDSQVIEQESERRYERLRGLVARLSPMEREVVELRFERGLSAREIDKKLHLGGQRRVYSLIDRIIRGLRRALDPNSQL